MEDLKNYLKFNKVDIVPSNGTVVARYWVNCYDRELVLLLNNITLTKKDIREIEMQLDNAYIEWTNSKDPNVYQSCCEEFMINSLDRYYRNCIVAVIYDMESEEEYD